MPTCITQWKHLMPAFFCTKDCPDDTVYMILIDNMLNKNNYYYCLIDILKASYHELES